MYNTVVTSMIKLLPFKVHQTWTNYVVILVLITSLPIFAVTLLTTTAQRLSVIELKRDMELIKSEFVCVADSITISTSAQLHPPKLYRPKDATRVLITRPKYSIEYIPGMAFSLFPHALARISPPTAYKGYKGYKGYTSRTIRCTHMHSQGCFTCLTSFKLYPKFRSRIRE